MIYNLLLKNILIKIKKIVIFGNYGGQNIGDEFILKNFASYLKNNFDLTVVSSNIFYTKKHHLVHCISPPPFGFRSLLKFKLFDFIKALKYSDYIVFGGGGLFQDNEPKAIFLWFYYFLICSFFKKKIFIVANSIGPLNLRLSKIIVKYIFSRVDFISLRDLESKKLLDKLNVKNKSVVCTDAVFLNKLGTKKIKNKSGSIIMLRGDTKIRKLKLDFLKKVLPKPIEFLAMDRIDEKDIHKNFQKFIDLNLVQEKIQNSKIVVSERLHGGILALKFTTPFLMLNSVPKIKNFFSYRGLENLVFENNFNEHNLQLIIKDILNNYNVYENKLERILEKEYLNAKKIFSFN